MERLDKIIAERMNLSRKDAKALIRTGEVTVNGARADADGLKCAETDIVRIGETVLNLNRHVYYMMNKPAGVLSATEDKNCETVLDFIPPELLRKGLFPAGRLDKDTEGFVLITDDGAFAHRMLSPKNHIPKTYYAVLNGRIPEELPAAFASGLDIGGGDVCSPAKIEILANLENAEVHVTIYEGMYHQVKRMFRKFSLEVTYLRRISIGGLALDPDLPPKGVREILHKELALIL